MFPDCLSKTSDQCTKLPAMAKFPVIAKSPAITECYNSVQCIDKPRKRRHAHGSSGLSEPLITPHMHQASVSPTRPICPTQ